LTLPDDVEQRGLYVARGRLNAKDSVIEQYNMVVLSEQTGITVTAEQDSLLVLVGGENLTRRHIWWNFVSSRKERIEQAKADWKNGLFPKIPGDDIEFIPLPDEN
jgi:redox-sensitive bicupin YhaK (pirin superfamily)